MTSTYVMLMENRHPLDEAVVSDHIAHLRALDDAGRLVLCGPLVEAGGLVIFEAESMEDAHQVALADPFVSRGFKTYQLKTLQIANRENDYDPE